MAHIDQVLQAIGFSLRAYHRILSEPMTELKKPTANVLTVDLFNSDGARNREIDVKALFIEEHCTCSLPDLLAYAQAIMLNLGLSLKTL